VPGDGRSRREGAALHHQREGAVMGEGLRRSQFSPI